MPFKKNEAQKPRSKLSYEETLKRKRERATQWRKTHPHDPVKRRKEYLQWKLKEFTKVFRDK